MERLWDSRHLCHTKWEAAVDTWVSSSSRKCYTSKGIYMFSSTFSFLPSRGSHISLLCTTAAHLQQNASFCLNYHWWCDKRIESQQIMFTSRTELIKASLGCCDAPFLYLRLMIRVISVLQPPPHPPGCAVFHQGKAIWNTVWSISVCVWSIFQIIWMTLWKNCTIWDTRTIYFKAQKRAKSLQCCSFKHLDPIYTYS